MKSPIQNEPPPSYKETMNVQHDEDIVENSQYEEFNEQESDAEIFYSDNLATVYDHIHNETMLQKQLEQNYPIKYVVVHCVLMAIINIVLISLQIVAIKNDAAISYIGSALWAGVYNMITVGMAFLTSLFIKSVKKK